jgi:hypothetical protein
VAGTLAGKPGEREFTILESSKIQAACGLTDLQWHTDLPELYTRMLEEGRTTVRVKALLEDIFRPVDMFSLESVQLSATDEMAKDVKHLNYGHANDLSYESSHRGVSPFTVIGVLMATASRRRRQAERYTRTTHVTLAEVTMADTNPDPIPTDYHGTVNLLKRYTMFLQHLVGPRSPHYVEVRRIAVELNANQQMFETLDARQIASLLSHSPPLQYAQIKLGPNGSCLDFLCFGECKNKTCSYKHLTTASIPVARAEAIAPKLGAAYTAYDASRA